MDLSRALAPKSDQLDADDLRDQPPRIFTITSVGENGGELADQQPVNIGLAEFPRVWRPSKGMLRVLADNWGKDVAKWVGRRVELYCDPNVYFGKEKRGGTRISRLSHIDSARKTLVNPRGGRGAYHEVKPLPVEHPAERPAEPLGDRIAKAVDWFAGQNVDLAALEAHVALPRAEWTEATLRTLQADREQIIGGGQ